MNQTSMETKLITLTSQLIKESGEQFIRQVKIDTPLPQLGIDSLGRAELFKRVEKEFGLSLPDSLLAQAETLGDIAHYVQSGHMNTAVHIDKNPSKTIHHSTAVINISKAKTLLDIVLMFNEKAPEKPHLYFQNEDGTEEIVTYGELLKASLGVAYSLHQRGLQTGDTIAIMYPTSPKFFYAFYGVLFAGGIPVPIYPPFRAHMLEAYAKTEAHILNSAQVRMLLTFNQAEKLSRMIQTFVPSMQVVTTIDALLNDHPLKSTFHAQPESFAFIQYTSGSTNDPKGVLLTHHNLMSNIKAYGKRLQITPEDVAVSWLPLYHDLGLIGMWLGSLYHGTPLVLMTPFSFLNRPERWLWTIHHHHGTISGAPNFAYELCVRKIAHSQLEGLDLNTWRLAANGAEKVYPHTLEQFAEKFARYRFRRQSLYPVYGLAESTVGLVIPPVNREFLVDRVDRVQFENEHIAAPNTDKNALEFISCGTPLDGHEVKIVNDDNEILPERHVGRLYFRGPSSMQGYYNNPSATTAIHHDGWWDSGDLAYIAEGEIYITGRRKDLIIKAGRNLYPAELEELVGSCQGVRQGSIVAFGVNDIEKGTEELVIVAESHLKKRIEQQAIADKIKEVIATALDIVPDHIVIVAPRMVPKTSSGKLQRALCKKMYLENKLQGTHTPVWMQVTKLVSFSIFNKVKRLFKSIFKAIYSVYFACILLITLLPVYFILLFASPKIAAHVCKRWAQLLLFLVFCPVKTVNAENLTHLSPMIYAANHASYLDVIILLSVLPVGTRFVGKQEIFSWPIIRTFMHKLGYLGVNRMDLSKGIEDTRQIENTLKDGHSLMIFPEGTFGYAFGLRPFRLGTFKVAVETNTPVCPISLQGTRFIYRSGEKLAFPGKIIVTASFPITPKGNEWQDVIQLRQAVREEIATYCGEPSLDFIAAQTIAPRLKE